MNPSKQTRDWNDLADLDPMWAVLSDPDKQFGNWGTEEFFATGEEEVAGLKAALRRLGIAEDFDSALDFGCGLGRLTRALSETCNDVVGIDISQGMIEQARSLNRHCQFAFNPYEDLRIFRDDRFQLVYSGRVLQHQDSVAAILLYISEFVRVLKKGGVAAFQIPSHVPFLNRFQPRRRIYSLLRAAGVSPKALYRWRLHPVRMMAVSTDAVVAAVRAANGFVLSVESDNSCPGVSSNIYYISK